MVLFTFKSLSDVLSLGVISLFSLLRNCSFSFYFCSMLSLSGSVLLSFTEPSLFWQLDLAGKACVYFP